MYSLFQSLIIVLTLPLIYLYPTNTPFCVTLINDRQAESRQLFNMINNYRTSKRLNYIQWDNTAVNMAGAKAFMYAKTKTWSHTIAGYSYDSVYRRCGGFSYAGENLSLNYKTPTTIFNAWLASPTHLAIIKGSYKRGAVFIGNSTLNSYTVLTLLR